MNSSRDGWGGGVFRAGIHRGGGGGGFKVLEKASRPTWEFAY